MKIIGTDTRSFTKACENMSVSSQPIMSINSGDDFGIMSVDSDWKYVSFHITELTVAQIIGVTIASSEHPVAIV